LNTTKLKGKQHLEASRHEKISMIRAGSSD